jgi:hypothetical protein
VFNFLSHKESENQNIIELPSHPSQNGHPPGSKRQQMQVKICAKKPLLYTVGGNVN